LRGGGEAIDSHALVNSQGEILRNNQGEVITGVW
jgi:hypothetical protein